MSDGARLGARMWLPNGFDGEPASTILEYIPYRKDDHTVARDSTLHPHLVEHGFACIRVDMRGSGSSDGVLMDEYSEQEMADGEEVLAWIADQPWSDGHVGMIGISWGGIIGLQMASRRVPALKAVIALGSSDSRYYDDAGYYIGCMVGQTIGWAAIMLGYNTRPPDPIHVGDSWRDRWMERLETAPMYLGRWLEHQRDDDYWRRGSISNDHSAIEVPVYLVSGHADCWPNTVSRLLEQLPGPRRGLQGQWCHRYPQMAVPGPPIGFLNEVVKWFDQHLRGRDAGLEPEPMYRVFMQSSVRPASFYDERPGRWVAEATWPSPQVIARHLHLGVGSLGDEPSDADPVSFSSPQTVGVHGGEYMPWFAFGPGPELPDDQRAEDEDSLVFDTDELTTTIEILGNPRITIEVASDRPQALVAARLCDVWPDGSSTLITRGILNLSQRDSKAEPNAVVPGNHYVVDVELNHVAYAVPSGHRVRLALSTSYWPIAWPAPTTTVLTVHPQTSYLSLPVRSPNAIDAPATPFAEPEPPGAAPIEQVRAHHENRTTTVDPSTGDTVIEITTDNGRDRYTETDLEVDSGSLQRFSIHPDDPLSAKAHYSWRWGYQRGGWQVETTSSTTMTCTETTFDVAAEIIATESGVEVFRRQWDESYPRDHF